MRKAVLMDSLFYLGHDIIKVYDVMLDTKKAVLTQHSIMSICMNRTE